MRTVAGEHDHLDRVVLHRLVEGGVEVVGHLQVLRVARIGPVHHDPRDRGSGRSTRMVSNSMRPRLPTVFLAHVVISANDRQGPMEFDTIVVERPEPRIARIVMNRPQARDAQNLQMTYDLNAAFDAAVQDDAVNVIILAGSGPHFSVRARPAAGRQEHRTARIFRRSEIGAASPNPMPTAASPASQEMYLHIARRWRNLGKADHRRSARQVHRRRADAGLGLRPDRGQRRRRVLRSCGDHGRLRRRMVRASLGARPAQGQGAAVHR